MKCFGISTRYNLTFQDDSSNIMTFLEGLLEILIDSNLKQSIS